MSGLAGIFAPRPKEDRTFGYRLYDNIVGIDDDTVTPGERLAQGINTAGKAIFTDPVGTAGTVAKAVEADLNNLMFEGGAMERPEAVLGYAAAPAAPALAATRLPNVVRAAGGPAQPQLPNLDLPETVAVATQVPESLIGIKRALDAGRSDLITPEMYEIARKANPKELNALLMENLPMQLMSTDGPDLGMNSRVYHYTQAQPRGSKFPGNPAFEYFDPDAVLNKLDPYSAPGQEFDILGPHVGTFDAANERRRQFTGAVTHLPEDQGGAGLPEGYVPDPQNSFGDVIEPDVGQMMELGADLSVPFTPEQGYAFIRELEETLPAGSVARTRMKVLGDHIEQQNYEHPGWDIDEPKEWRDRWSEDDINRVLSDLAANDIFTPEGQPREGIIRTNMPHIRRELARRGFTNVPYRNRVEDAGSTSHVMLTDRPSGSKAVLRDREAGFHPLLKHLPNLTAAGGGAALLSELFAQQMLQDEGA